MIEILFSPPFFEVDTERIDDIYKFGITANDM